MPKNARATDIKGQIARRLRMARSVVFDSAALCGKALSTPKTTWENYEKGERYPAAPLLVKFCDITGFTTDFIYRGMLKGIKDDVQLRLVAAFPELVDEAPDVDHSSKVEAQASVSKKPRAARSKRVLVSSDK